jgi:hypothetical protein
MSDILGHSFENVDNYLVWINGRDMSVADAGITPVGAPCPQATNHRLTDNCAAALDLISARKTSWPSPERHRCALAFGLTGRTYSALEPEPKIFDAM